MVEWGQAGVGLLAACSSVPVGCVVQGWAAAAGLMHGESTQQWHSLMRLLG